MLRLSTLATLSFACALWLSPSARSQEHPPQAPRVETQQKPESTIESQQKPDTHEQPSPPTATPNPQIVPNIRNTPSETKAHQGEDQGTEFWPPLYGYRLKIADTLLVAFTFGLFIATWHLFRATKRLTVGAEKTAERQLRAYVGVKSGHLVFEIIDRNIVATIVIRIENFGETPAYGVRSSAGFVNATTFPTETSNRIIRISGNNVIFPHSSQRIMFKRNFDIPPGKEIIRTFVFGEIIYNDTFGNTHSTTFRYTAQMLSRGDSRADLAPCDEGNDAT
jgi:hypothetical protein